MAERPNEPQQLNIELPSDIANGVYSNLVIVSHSNAEFVIDFVQVLPGTPKAEVRSRVIMTPYHAKRFMLAMEDNIDKFEDSFGEISIPELEMSNNMPPGGGFGGGPAGYA
jgi:hypothetical protein